MRIAIRVDASKEIGSGHVMRCATLAHALEKQGTDIFFICRELEGHYCDWLEEQEFKVYRLPEPASSKIERSKLSHTAWLGVSIKADIIDSKNVLEKEGKVDWLIVDHYALDREWEKSIRACTNKLMVIDDIADRDHDCDLLLDQNLQSVRGRYSNHVAPKCTSLLGPKYSLLRTQFSLARQSLSKRDGSVGRILVFFGGVDVSGETLKTLSAIKMLDTSSIVIDVVVGYANPHIEEIKLVCNDFQNANFYCQVQEMAALMAVADLFIGAGGTSSWERCCLGLPALIWATADNQIEQSETLGQFGAQVYLGSAQSVTIDRLAPLIHELTQLPELLKHMSGQGQVLADGRGVGRVMNYLLSPLLTLRCAKPADSGLILEWRNHPDTRQYFFDPGEIDLETHEQWFTGGLNDPNRELLIAEQDGQPIGVIRYDIEAGHGLVSLYLAPGLTGKGWGMRLLLAGESWLQNKRKDVQVCYAEVTADNKASLALFKAAGYQFNRYTFRKEINSK